MSLRTTTVLSLSALAVLALAGCSHGSAISSGPTSSPAVSVHPDGEGAPASAPLSSTALAKLLLDESDLGGDYTLMPQRTAAHDDVTVIGCPALAKLGDATTGTSLVFPPQGEGVLHLRWRQRLRAGRGAVQRHCGEAVQGHRGDLRCDGLLSHIPSGVGQQRHQRGHAGDGRPRPGRRAVEPAAHLLDRRAAQRRQADGHPHRRRPDNVSGSPGLVDANLEKALAKAQAAF